MKVLTKKQLEKLLRQTKDAAYKEGWIAGKESVKISQESVDNQWKQLQLAKEDFEERKAQEILKGIQAIFNKPVDQRFW